MRKRIERTSAVCGYVRVSLEEQASEGVSLDAQESRIRAYCKMRGLDLVEVIVDAGVSAGNPLGTRDGGKHLLDLVRARKVSGVVALKLDRLFRRAQDCLGAVEEFDRHGVGLHLVDMGGQTLDTTGAVGRLFLTLLAGFAEFERNQVRERTSFAMQHMRARGLYTGGHVRYGFHLDDGGNLVAVDNERDVVERARRLRESGMSLRAIGVELASVGHVSRSGGPFGPSQVMRMVAEDEAA